MWLGTILRSVPYVTLTLSFVGLSIVDIGLSLWGPLAGDNNGRHKQVHQLILKERLILFSQKVELNVLVNAERNEYNYQY